MANENDHSGAAFPGIEYYDEKPVGAQPGMTRREYFAAHAPDAPIDFDFSGESQPQAPERLAGRPFNGKYVDLDDLSKRIKHGQAPGAVKVYGGEVVQICEDYLKLCAEHDAATSAWANRAMAAREAAWRYAYADAMVDAGAKLDTAPVSAPGFQDPLVKLHIHDLREALQETLTAMTAAANHLEACEAGKIAHPFESASLPRLLDAIEKARRVL